MDPDNVIKPEVDPNEQPRVDRLYVAGWSLACLVMFAIGGGLGTVIQAWRGSNEYMQMYHDLHDTFLVKYKGWSHSSHGPSGYPLIIPPRPGTEQQRELDALRKLVRHIEVDIEADKAAAVVRQKAREDERAQNEKN